MRKARKRLTRLERLERALRKVVEEGNDRDGAEFLLMAVVWTAPEGTLAVSKELSRVER